MLKCNNLTLKYENTVVVQDLTFSVHKGDYLCIVGENGSGKSTLLKSLIGLKNYNTGNIVLDEGLKKNEIGYLPQQSTINRDFPASVMEVVLSGFLNTLGFRPFYTVQMKKEAKENLRRLDMADDMQKCFKDLSGGQQQRVLLARALCATSELLILDEPITGLDPIASGELYALIRRLNQEDNVTIIMVSHDIHSAIHNATHILHLMTDSYFFGTTAEYLKSDAGRLFVNQGRCIQCSKALQ